MVAMIFEPRGGDVLQWGPGVRLRQDRRRNQMVLLTPEAAIVPDPIALAILEKIDAESTFSEIVDRLVEEFDGAEREQIRIDSAALLGGLIEKGFLLRGPL